MAAPKYTDRLRAQELRTLALDEMILVLKGNDAEFKKALLLRLAGSVLPRLNEHTGEDGKAIVLRLEKDIAEQNGVDTSTIPNSQG